MNGVKILHNSQHREEFLVFMSDLLNSAHYKASSDLVFCMAKFVEIVVRWKNLFKIIGDKSYFDIKGIFGELFVWGQLFLKGINTAELLEAWQIDRKSRVDFIFNSKQTEIEVKSIEAVVDKNISISSIEQLTDVGRKQFLVVNKMKSGTGQTINDLYLSLREKLDEQFQSKLDALLVEFKLQPKTLKNFDNSKFSVLETLYYKVDDKFPKISRSTVPDAIVTAKYDISLSSIPMTNQTSIEALVEILK